MQIEHRSGLEYEGSSEGAIEAQIKKENLPFILDLITRQQYRDPIGSIVREITSNCFDAHIALGSISGIVDDPVVIKFDKDELGPYISFVDVGIGMSPDVIKDVYLSYGESTKRADNTQIGGFGLGGKSPLAYAESFYVTTIVNKICYEYIVHKGTSLPTIELINSFDLNKRNGTEVRIYFVDKQDSDKFSFYEADREKFIIACRKQLAYFDNVYFEPTWMFDNHYQIYEGKTFKVRSDVGEHPYSRDMHLCIGKVAYPIDWNILGMESIRVPVALKFEVGDLVVTPERESIRYIKVNGIETKDIIRKKVEACVEELKELYFKQEGLICTSVINFLERRKETPILKIGNEVMLNLKGVVAEGAGVKYPPLEPHLTKISADIFEAWRIKYRKDTNKGLGKKDIVRLVTRSTLEQKVVYLTKHIKHSPTKSFFLCKQNRTNDVSVGKLEMHSWISLHKYSKLGRIAKDSKTNIVTELKKLKDLIEKEIRGALVDYDAIIVPKEIEIAYRKVNTKKQDDELVVYNCLKNDVKEYHKMSMYEKFTGFIIVGFDDDKKLLKNFAKLFEHTKYDNKYALKIIRTAEGNYKHYRKLPNAVHVQSFIGDNKVFRHFATALTIKKESKMGKFSSDYESNHGLTLRSLIELVFPHLINDSRDVSAFVKEYSSNTKDCDKDFIESIISVAKQYNLIDNDVYRKHLAINKQLNRVELLEEIKLNIRLLPYIVDYFVLKKKEVSRIWTKPQPYEIELIKELISKSEYVLTLEYHKETDYIEHISKELKIQQALLNYYNYAA